MLPLVEDKKIKTGCFTFDILIDGTIEATRHPAGYLIPFIHGIRKTRVQFMSCTKVCKTPKWPLVFSSLEKDFSKMTPGALSNIDLILVRGLANIGGSNNLVYHKWKGKGCTKNIYDLIEHHKFNPVEFVQQTFQCEPTVTPIKTIWLHYASYIQGNSFHHWQKPSTFIKNGRMFYCSADQPLSLCKEDPFPLASNRCSLLQLPKMSIKVDGYTSRTNQSTVTNTAAGAPSLYSIKGTTSQIIYFKPLQETTELSNVLEKGVFWQPLHTPHELSKRQFVSLSPAQYDELYKYFLERGPIPSAEFNEKVVSLSNKEDGLMISLSRLVFQEVSVVFVAV